MQSGKLFLIATPIGNLDDITFRAIKILKGINLVLAEDTRRTGILLKHFEIEKSLVSFFEGNEERKIAEILAKLKSGQNIAVVCDAGTPLISDPGFKLVRAAISENILVDSIPGPSAVLTALTISGLPTDKFLFLGYLPKSAGKRQRLLENLKKILEIQKLTIILFESPHRLIKTLMEIRNNFADTDIVICRELTKIYQEVRREKISDSIKHFGQKPPKGEFTLIL